MFYQEDARPRSCFGSKHGNEPQQQPRVETDIPGGQNPEIPETAATSTLNLNDQGTQETVSISRDEGSVHLLRDEQLMVEAGVRFAKYLRDERERYYTLGRPLPKSAKLSCGPFFSVALLERVRVVPLAGHRVPNPPFYPEARQRGFVNLPDLSHRESLTFLDVLVFQERLTERNLFHALVHAAQVQALGIHLFADLFVRGFARSGSYSTVPLKAQAYALDLRFATNTNCPFSVEGEIFRWLREKRY